MKQEERLGSTEFVAFRLKTNSYLMDDGSNNKKVKQEKCVKKLILKSNDYKHCLENSEIILKSQQRLKSELHNVYN